MPRRIVRKLEIPRYQPVEERLWPTLVALAVLTGTALGTVAAYLDFDDPTWYANAWTWMVVVPLLALLAAFWLAFVDQGRHRRRVQLALVLGILTHLALLVACLESQFATDWLRPAETSARSLADRKEQLQVPEEFRPRTQPTPKAWDRPVATQEPTEVPPAEKHRVTRTEPRQPQQAQPVPVPKPKPTVKPERVARRDAPSQPTQAAPTSSRVSRRESDHMLQPSAVAAEQRLAGSQASSQAIESPAAAGRRAAASSAANRSTASSETTQTPSSQRSQVERVASSRSMPSVRRSQNVPRRTVRQVVAGAPVEASRTASRSPQSDRQLEAETVAASRPRTAAEDVDRTAVALEPQPRNISIVPTRREVELPQEPQVVSGEAPPARRLTDRPAATISRLADVATPAQEAAAQAVEADAAETSRARSSQSRPSEVAARSPVAEEELAATGSASIAKPDHLARSDSDQLMRDSAQLQAPARAQTQQLAGSPIELPRSADVGSAQGAAEPALEASAVDIGQSGIAGGGASPNVSRYEESGPSPSLVASGSMPRRAAMQDQPEGASLAPSTRAEITRRRAEVNAAGSSVDSAVVAQNGAASSQQLPQLSAASAAGRRQAAATAANGPTSAAQGTDSVDLGVTQRVAGRAAGRASGGGQPEVGQTLVAESKPRRGRSAGQQAPHTSGPSTESIVGTDTSAGNRSGFRSRAALDAASLADVSGARSAEAKGVASPGPTRDSQSGESTADSIAVATSARPVRTEMGGAADGAPQAGGGSASPARRGRSPVLRAPTQADTSGISVASSGTGQASAAVAMDASRTGRVSGAETTGSVNGTATPDGSEDGASASLSEPVGLARTDSTGRLSPDSDSLAHDSRRGRRSAPSLGTTASVELPEPIGSGAAESGTGLAELEGVGTTSSRHAASSASDRRVAVTAEAGEGGFGTVPAIQVGIRREAVVESDVDGSSGRFLSRRSGGVPDISTTVALGREPFRQRMERLDNEQPGRAGSPGELAIPTEKAIELGLLFLKRSQAGDGSWKLETFDDMDGSVQMRSDTAATGLALLAFQGAGYHHRSKKYGKEIGAALKFLIDRQRPNGDLYIPMGESSDPFCRLYSHGIASIALCEAYGMTQDPQLKAPAQRALDFIAASQDKRRGGWRYRPGFSSDTSVTGWMVMALKSGQLAGLKIDGATMKGVERWLNLARVDGREYLFRYNPNASDAQRHGRLPSPTMTAVGLLMRMYTGWQRGDVRLRRGADYLLETPPAIGTVNSLDRDTYYWYYATQVMYHMGGDHWQEWYSKLYPLLIDSQIAAGDLAGSWDPNRPVPDRWSAHAGRIYVTTMNLLSLEVRYRILPLYEETIGRDEN